MYGFAGANVRVRYAARTSPLSVASASMPVEQMLRVFGVQPHRAGALRQNERNPKAPVACLNVFRGTVSLIAASLVIAKIRCSFHRGKLV